ncbi:MAG: nuclear transport factor 2 family protein [Gammaproteobacteria bacterium]|nr:nuclear transport factor 2 family protein [Gammaproteobacteria bacterium]
MKKNRQNIFVTGFIGLLALGACAKPPPADPLLTVAADFMAAFNDHDPAAMVALVSEDVRWLTVDGDSIAIEVQGRDALEAAMADYFEAGPRSPSRMRFARSDGEYVLGVEEIMRGPASEGRNQCSVVVYRFEASLIRDVWYYHPAYQC